MPFMKSLENDRNLKGSIGGFLIGIPRIILNSPTGFQLYHDCDFKKSEGGGTLR